MRNLGIGLLVTLLLAVGLLVLLRSPGDVDARLDPSALELGVATKRGEARLPVESTEAPSADVAVARAVSEGLRVPIDERSGPALLAARGAIELTFEFGATGERAQGARVTYLEACPKETLGRIGELLLGTGELAPGWLAGAPVFGADEAGRVEVPVPVGMVLVVAEARDAVGFRILQTPRFGDYIWNLEPGLVRLERPRDLLLRFVDEAAEPRADFLFELGPSNSYMPGSATSGHTDAGGRAWLHHSRTLLPELGGIAGLRLSYRAFGRSAPRILLDPLAMPLDPWGAPEPMTVIVPRGVDMLVRIVDPAGQPILDRRVTVVVEAEFDRHADEDSMEQRLTFDGVAKQLVLDMPPGRRYAVATRRRHYGEEWQFDGAMTGVLPEEPGQLVTVELVVEPKAALLVRCRPVTPAGFVAARGEFVMEVDLRGTSEAAEELHLRRRERLREGGELWARIEGRAHSLSESEGFTLGVGVSSMSDVGDLVFGGLPEVPRSVVDGVLDLGRIELRRAGVLLRGQVVDSSGDAVAGALIVAGGTSADPDAERSARERIRYLGHSEQAVSESDGRFELRGRPPGGKLAVKASCAGYRSTSWQLVEDLTLPVRIELTRVGTIAGRLVPGSGRTSSDFEVGYVREQLEGGRRRLRITKWVDPAEDSGKFRLENLESGSYTVLLRVKDTEEQLGTFEHVVVEAGKVTRDPRLAAIDLAGFGRLLRLSLVDEEGGGVSYAALRFSRAGFDLSRAWYWEGHQSYCVGRLPVTVQIVARGFVPKRVEVFEPEVEVELTRGPRGRVSLAEPVHLPENGFIDLTFSPVEDIAGIEAEYAEVSVELGDTPVDFQLSVPGKWMVYCSLIVMLGDTGSYARLPADSDPIPFEVRSDRRVNELVLAITQADIDAAWAKILADE